MINSITGPKVITFSRREKVPEGRMRGLLPEGYVPAVRTLTSTPLIRRYGATFSQREKGDLVVLRTVGHAR